MDSTGPRLFLSCPVDVEGSRVWFTDLWNYSLVPYLLEAVREGLQVSPDQISRIKLLTLWVSSTTPRHLGAPLPSLNQYFKTSFSYLAASLQKRTIFTTSTMSNAPAVVRKKSSLGGSIQVGERHVPVERRLAASRRAVAAPAEAGGRGIRRLQLVQRGSLI